ncbi:hypothetical protein A0256_23290 [Mucilaginibacter sp. PAMC 26640]|nr:hypothetical protein A0256_23290 [Mucilaginibacter sp. PAMC 26640]
MTKVTILGQAEAAEPEKKKIVFVRDCFYEEWVDSDTKPSMWMNIELVAIGFADGYDLMFGYDTDRGDGGLHLGHFNDGVV